MRPRGAVEAAGARRGPRQAASRPVRRAVAARCRLCKVADSPVKPNCCLPVCLLECLSALACALGAANYCLSSCCVDRINQTLRC
ncbi:hypothetical protein BS78_07G097800 [Paspalum vaginatum]|nr:hypothetical protein BS78_07G097800 [Paspalum vaginatum]